MRQKIILIVLLFSAIYVGYGMEETIKKEIILQDSVVYVLSAQYIKNINAVIFFNKTAKKKVERRHTQVRLYEQEWSMVIPCISSSGFV